MKEMCDLINAMQGAVSVISVASPWVMHLLKVLRDISTSGRNSSLTEVSGTVSVERVL